MEFIVTLLLIGVAIAGLYYIYRFINDGEMVSTDEKFSQLGVTVDYAAHTITIKKHSYPVGAVTGIAKITEQNGRRRNFYIEIKVDDLRKPVHNIAVIGFDKRATEFMQRLCVAIRKAGGPDFY